MIDIPNVDQVGETGGEGDKDGLLPAPAHLNHLAVQLVVAQLSETIPGVVSFVPLKWKIE